MIFFFFKQKTSYEMLRSLVGSEMCIRDRIYTCMGRSKQNLLLFHMDDLAKELNVLNAYVNKLTI